MSPTTRCATTKKKHNASCRPITRSVTATKKHRSTAGNKKHYNKAAIIPTTETKPRYVPKVNRKTEERELHIKKGTLSKFVKQAKAVVNMAIKKARQTFGQYMSLPILLEEDLSCHWHSVEETKILIDKLNLQEMIDHGDITAVTITIPDNQRIGEKEGEEIMKLTFSQNDPQVKKSLNKRNPRNVSSGLKDANIILIEDQRSEPMAIILRQIIPLELSTKFDSFRQYYDGVNTLYTKGCRAATYPDTDDILRCLKDQMSKDAGGFKQSNVKMITGLRVTSTGRNVMLEYRNKKKGKKIEWAFTSNLDRKAFDRTQFNETPVDPLLQFMEKLYENVSRYWIHKFGCDENKIKDEMARAMNQLQVSGGLIKQYSDKMGIHSDPSSWFPSCIFGPTIYKWDVNTGRWGDRICDGGRLVLVDGCIFLEYLPQDVIVLNGNLLHGVTRLQQKKQGTQLKGGYSRFSIQMYTNYNRNENPRSRYGSFSCKW
mmetsp:Transcript_32659/g.66624  ORF Transcript_32659/g.66624 Transcript_32659/m.66624 type:complete len:486 (-) Transcript_32659:48-1505(-)